MQSNRNSFINTYEKSYREIYMLNTLIELISESCQERENKAIYYGLKRDGIEKLSNERNNYLNTLTLISDRINNLKQYYSSMEEEISLYQNAHNRC